MNGIPPACGCLVMCTICRIVHWIVGVFTTNHAPFVCRRRMSGTGAGRLRISGYAILGYMVAYTNSFIWLNVIHVCLKSCPSRMAYSFSIWTPYKPWSVFEQSSAREVSFLRHKWILKRNGLYVDTCCDWFAWCALFGRFIMKHRLCVMTVFKASATEHSVLGSLWL